MTERLSRRAMLALITLADLPTPHSLGFIDDGYPDDPLLSMHFGTLIDGQAWSRHLDGSTHIYQSDDRVYLSSGHIDWHGWSVVLYADEPAPAALVALDADTVGRLALVAGEAVTA